MWDTPAFLQPPDSICQNEITCKLVSSYSLSENSIQIIVPEESNWAKDPRKTSLTPAATEAKGSMFTPNSASLLTLSAFL